MSRKDEPYPFGTQYSADGLGRTQYAKDRLKNKKYPAFWTYTSNLACKCALFT